jgi:hypothetical protein
VVWPEVLEMPPHQLVSATGFSASRGTFEVRDGQVIHHRASTTEKNHARRGVVRVLTFSQGSQIELAADCDWG